MKDIPIWAQNLGASGFNSHGSGKETTESDDNVMFELLCKLSASSLFLNTAVSISDRGEYNVIKNELMTVAFPHPSSSLFQLRDAQTATSKPPSLMVFHTLFQSKKPYMSILTPICLEWIELYAPKFYMDIRNRLQGIRCDRIEMSVSNSVVKSVLGNRCEKLKIWEEELKCTLQIDFESCKLVAWCSFGTAVTTQQFITNHFDRARHSIYTKVSEELVLGSLRAVLGPGAVVEQLLFGAEEYISITLSNLPPGYTAEKLLLLGSCHNNLRVREHYILNDGMNGSKVLGNVIGKLVYWNTNDAKHAYCTLNNELVEKYIISVKIFSQVDLKEASMDTQGKLELTWCLMSSTGDAYLQFLSADAANEALRRLRTWNGRRVGVVRALGEYPYGKKEGVPLLVARNGPAPRILNNEGFFVTETTSSITSTTNKNPQPYYTLRLTGVPLAWDEIDIMDNLPLALNLKPHIVEVKRSKPSMNTNISDMPISIAVNDMIELLPKVCEIDSFVSMIERKGKTGLNIFLKSGAKGCDLIQKSWSAG